jgi:hypothetical protein
MDRQNTGFAKRPAGPGDSRRVRFRDVRERDAGHPPFCASSFARW